LKHFKMGKDTMKAVVFKGKLKVELEDRPIPKIQDPTDIIVKVTYSALCGSELHVFRGHQPSKEGFIMGHEFTGDVVEIGSAIKNFQKGDTIVTPFTTSCGECFYCKGGFSSRCEKCLLFGCPLLDGGQAEYARIPYADTTAVKAPEGIEEKKLVLMADIFPTGYFAAQNAFYGFDEKTIQQSTVVVIGCGPVGLCALINTLEYKPAHVLAVDGVESRLELARKLGAEPWNYQTDRAGLDKRVKELTDGRGADTVIEGVGLSAALQMGFELLRPWGNISSFGVHNGEIPWTGNQAYGKNLKIQMGRCPVRSLFPQALEMLKKKQHLLDFMTDKIMPLSDAVEGYAIFNDMKVQKVIFEAQK
jgi:threonine dehydrogenase-like Zn-dependent dehydrogenase